MNTKKMIIFVIGNSDNTSTQYIISYLIKHRINIDGVIFQKNNLKHGWKRFLTKIKVRGVFPALKRIIENLFLRKKQITKICQQNIKKVIYVDEINSSEVRDILITNNVEILLLTTTYIIKPIIIDIGGLTIINAHTGWLPKYRGLDANLKALRDCQEPGVSVHSVTKKIDAGEVYLREKFQINYNEKILKQIDQKELELAGKLYVKAIKLKEKDMLEPIVTTEQLGKYSPPLNKKERNRIIKQLKTPRIFLKN